MDLEKLAEHSHQFSQRIYYEDTDFSGAIYHSAYLKFFERGRTEWLRQLNIQHYQLFDRGYAFMVSNIQVDFISSAEMDEIIYIETNVGKITPARIFFIQEIRRTLTLANISEAKKDLIAAAKVTVCAVSKKNNVFMPVRLSQVLVTENVRINK